MALDTRAVCSDARARQGQRQQPLPATVTRSLLQSFRPCSGLVDSSRRASPFHASSTPIQRATTPDGLHLSYGTDRNEGPRCSPFRCKRSRPYGSRLGFADLPTEQVGSPSFRKLATLTRVPRRLAARRSEAFRQLGRTPGATSSNDLHFLNEPNVSGPPRGPWECGSAGLVGLGRKTSQRRASNRLSRGWQSYVLVAHSAARGAESISVPQKGRAAAVSSD